ncbi:MULTISPECIES: penicillin-binding transpeptidase domain-containing protein [Streptomyces]|uniref:Penicillin-binding protein n=1 Tax=Streptomyces tsukubensis (strain DSM 42081 / NBRC 108919 / NRRL 18488 / 9993) TaxID=1114943 RepID=I2N251_STRT9|nr:penicillin-binding transpeptidase domain-containing protein [Streptomyces tsukubensis]MYS62858.1 penicillin-binding protein 2 [Streptomyces sp. SID5473]AZK95228.1 penicillin-binding protein [Streptomyces tsukubensis]EIF91098.1 penicillin-binding protein transpeptidase [Streptomyces tsukubensis NRRL18488]QKM68711.1 penicillin-binding protein [Streptomyces tsukubensis NRRL18488]TAI43517.1 penicillin-binding protein 2 [Streptomyces tsukubensis]
MNKPLRRIAIFCGLLVLALLVRANWLQYVEAEKLNTHDKNRRVLIERYAAERGNIIVDGKPITGSVKTDSADFAYKRTYVNGPMWAPVTGYASQVFGANQLEKLEDGILTGNSDQLFFDRTMAMFTGDKKKGGNVVTTLNGAAQTAAFKGLGSKKGAVAAIDPKTGKILALASTPSYDPGAFAGSATADEKAWATLSSKDNKEKPMLNRALREVYPPGSVFKVVTAAAALEHGKVDDINAKTDTEEPYILPNTRTPMKNMVTGCEDASLKFALQISCNSVFAKLGDEVGKDKMLETVKKFGFNNDELDTPVRAAMSRYNETMDRPGNALSSIGQFDTATTPLQMAMVAAAIANDGKLMKPYMVDQLVAPNLDVISQTKPQEMSRPLSSENAQLVRDMMENVVENGGGRKAALGGGVKVGGKTGTAQHGEKNSKRPYAWFISYAMTDDGSPVAVAVVVEDSGASREDISGGGLAAPIAKDVMKAVLDSRR